MPAERASSLLLAHRQADSITMVAAHAPGSSRVSNFCSTFRTTQGKLDLANIVILVRLIRLAFCKGRPDKRVPWVISHFGQPNLLQVTARAYASISTWVELGLLLSTLGLTFSP